MIQNPPKYDDVISEQPRTPQTLSCRVTHYLLITVSVQNNTFMAPWSQGLETHLVTHIFGGHLTQVVVNGSMEEKNQNHMTAFRNKKHFEAKGPEQRV